MFDKESPYLSDPSYLSEGTQQSIFTTKIPIVHSVYQVTSSNPNELTEHQLRNYLIGISNPEGEGLVFLAPTGEYHFKRHLSLTLFGHERNSGLARDRYENHSKISRNIVGRLPRLTSTQKNFFQQYFQISWKVFMEMMDPYALSHTRNNLRRTIEINDMPKEAEVMFQSLVEIFDQIFIEETVLERSSLTLSAVTQWCDFRYFIPHPTKTLYLLPQRGEIILEIEKGLGRKINLELGERFAVGLIFYLQKELEISLDESILLLMTLPSLRRKCDQLGKVGELIAKILDFEKVLIDKWEKALFDEKRSLLSEF